jgi:O-antigen biosynthesis protein
MKFSIITPEHDRNNIPFLLELYDSILHQTYVDWEWVLYLNNNCSYSDLPSMVTDNPRVSIYSTQDGIKDVGYIKNKAFHLGTGDILVEADHDDILTPDCLYKLHEAFLDPNVGFAYSDNAVLHHDNAFVPYDPQFGWSYRTFDWKGKQLIAMNSFPPSAQALGYIWYAPDHVRAWRKDVYTRIGGHNPELSICDDHELMIRTYLNTKMYHIPEVLYIYRVTGNNTWLERNEAIQQKTVELFDQNIRALAEKDARDRGLLLVDIGGGYNPYPGYTTVDQRETADYVCDLNDGIPLPDNSVGVLNASHIIEHLHDKTKIMGEIHRVLAHGGYAFIEVPSTDGRGAFQDPTHVSYWNENSFLYYTDKYMADFIENYTIKFQEYRKMTWYPNEWMQNLQVLVTNVVLTAVKDGGVRYPGPLKF